MAHWFLERIHDLATADKGKTFADFLLWQHKGESTDGTSKVFLLTNNPGGLTQGMTPNKSGARQPPKEGGAYYKEYATPEEAYADIKRSFYDYYPEIYNAKTVEEYATILHDNGYFTTTIPKYIEMLYNNSDGSAGSYSGGGTDDEDPMTVLQNTNFYGGLNPMYYLQNAPISPYGSQGSLQRNSEYHDITRGANENSGGWWSDFADNFANSWLNNGSVSLGRNYFTMGANEMMGFGKEDLMNDLDDATLKEAMTRIGLSEDEYKAQSGRRYETFQQLRQDAWDKRQLLLLAKMKGEDFDREQRVENRSTTAMGVTGMVAGTLLDPLNLIPAVGQSAIGLKLVSRAGLSMASKLLASPMAHMTEIGLTNGLINVADQYVANKSGYWNNNNYAMSFLLGAGAGAGLSFLRRHSLVAPYVEKGENLKKFEGEVTQMTNKAIEGFTETKPPKAPVRVADEMQANIPSVRAEAQKVTPLKGLQPLDDDLIERVTQSAMARDKVVDSQLVNILNDRYGLKIKGEINGGQLMKYLHNEPDAIYLRPPKVAKLMEAYQLETIEDLAKHALAYKKHPKTGVIKEYFEDIVGGKLKGTQFMEIARHIKNGGTFRDLTVKLDDGSMFVNGAHLSEDNLITKAVENDAMYADPEELTKEAAKNSTEYDPFRLEKEGRAENNAGYIRSQDVVDSEQQLGGSKVVQVAGRKAETNRWVGNRYGVFINSVSTTMNKVGKLFGIDPRLREANNTGNVAVSMQKKILMKKYEKPQSDYMNAFNKWCLETGHVNTNSNRRQFNEEVNRVYDSLYNPYNVENYTSTSKAINDAVQAVKDFRDLDLRLHKINGTLPKDFEGAGELWRRIDYDKQGYLRTLFSSDKKFFEYMKNVARESIHWGDISDKFKTDYIMNLDLSDKEMDVIMKRAGLPYEFVEKYDGNPNHYLNREELEDVVRNLIATDEKLFRDVVSGHWADQITCRQDALASDLHAGSNRMGYYQGRLPMDTTQVFELPNGSLFTFNDSLRNQDLSTIMAYVANRSSGTMALKRIGIDNPVTDLKKIYERIEGELAEAVQQKKISMKDMARELEETKDVFQRTSGSLIFPEAVNPNTVPDMIKRILLGESYRQNGFNFGINQIAEMIGGISKVGVRALTHYVPILHDLLHNLKYSKDFSAAQLKEFRDRHLGYDLAQHIWFNPQLKRSLFETAAEQQGATMKILGNVQSAVEYGGKITSTINQITRLTHLSVAGIKADILPEMMLWARGEFKSTLRKDLFSNRHLAEAGITNAEEFKSILRTRLMHLGDEKDALSKAITKWQDEDMASYMKLEAFLDLSSQKAILQPDLWNTSKKMNGWWGLFQGIAFQFKNFSQVALNGHLGRVLNSREREDVTLLMTTALSNGAVWALSVFFNSYKYFGGNEEKRQAYLEKTLTPERMLATGLLRSSVLSGLSFANDAWEMTNGGTSSRTTVDRMPESDNLAYNVITQFPAVQSAFRAFNGAASMPEIMANLASNKEADYDPLTRLFPIDRWIPIKGVLSIMADEADIEKKRQKEHQKKQEEYNKNKLEKRKERNGQQNVQDQSLLDMLK